MPKVLVHVDEKFVKEICLKNSRCSKATIIRRQVVHLYYRETTIRKLYKGFVSRLFVIVFLMVNFLHNWIFIIVFPLNRFFSGFLLSQQISCITFTAVGHWFSLLYMQHASSIQSRFINH